MKHNSRGMVTLDLEIEVFRSGPLGYRWNWFAVSPNQPVLGGRYQPWSSSYTRTNIVVDTDRLVPVGLRYRESISSIFYVLVNDCIIQYYQSDHTPILNKDEIYSKNRKKIRKQLFPSPNELSPVFLPPLSGRVDVEFALDRRQSFQKLQYQIFLYVSAFGYHKWNEVFFWISFFLGLSSDHLTVT